MGLNRCPYCEKFASFRSDSKPLLIDCVFDADTGAAWFAFRITNNCAICNAPRLSAILEARHVMVRSYLDEAAMTYGVEALDMDFVDVEGAGGIVEDCGEVFVDMEADVDVWRIIRTSEKREGNKRPKKFYGVAGRFRVVATDDNGKPLAIIYKADFESLIQVSEMNLLGVI